MLPKSLATKLEAFAQTRLVDLARMDPRAIATEIDELEATSFAAAQEEIASSAMLDERHHYTRMKLYAHLILLRLSPLWAHLFIHHRDGYLRAASLDTLNDAARSAFQVMAIAYRLNDWVEPVRRKAEACARRVFPGTDPDILASAGLILIPQMGRWSRWHGPPPILTETFGRADVEDRFVSAFLRARSGPMTTTLRDHLRRPALDRHLDRLAREAFLPGVRSVALQVLLEGKARWQTGRRFEWVNKQSGHGRMIAIHDERAIAQGRDVDALLKQGLEDRAVLVRRTALDALIRLRDDNRVEQALLDRLAVDRSPSIKDRVDFLRRTFRGSAICNYGS